MPHTTEFAVEEKLSKFKALAGAYSIASRPKLVGTHLADCLLHQPYFANELGDVEAALLRLQTRIDDPRLKPILGKLFGQLEDWDQALSEILTFAYLESLGILHSIGWPSDFSGDPPFDFALSVPGGILAGDVKPANGSGYRLLEANLSKCEAEQATRSGTANPGVTIRYHGPLTQEVVGPSLRSATSDFAKMISNKRLSEPETFVLTIGSTRVAVMVGKTKDHGGGITGSSALSDRLAPTLAGHLKAKANQPANTMFPF